MNKLQSDGFMFQLIASHTLVTKKKSMNENLIRF